MRKIILPIIVLSLFLGLGVFAQNEILSAKEPLPELPDPGQKPGDFFYFLDQWTEGLQEFLTFNPEAKALLQTERALERIAEVKAILEIKGVAAPGLDVAQEKIQSHMARASQIVEQQKAKGRKVAQLAQKLDDDFDAGQELLEQTLKVEKAKLKAQKEEVKLQILQARRAGDLEKVTQLRATLAEIETQKEALEQKWETQEELLELEEEKLEAELEAEEKGLEELEEQEEDLFEQKEREIEKAFEQREKALELQEKSLEIDLRKAILEGDEVLAQQIRVQLVDLENQKEALEVEEEAVEEALEKEEKELEKARNLKERAEEQVKEAEEELAETKEEMTELVEVPEVVSTLIIEAESKLANAKADLEAEKYGEAYGQAMAAEMLARNAARKMEQREELEEIKELKEKLELKEEIEEEVGEKEERKQKEERSQEVERGEELQSGDLSSTVQQLQGVWKLERIFKTSGVEVDKELDVEGEEYLSFKGNRVCGTGVRDICYLDYVSFSINGQEIVTGKIIGLLGVGSEKIYFRNGKVEYHGFTEKGATIKHFYGKISTEPLGEKSTD